MNIQQFPSTNFSSRKGYSPQAIVIHIMEGYLIGTDSWFGTRASGVSAHYGIGKTGEVHQYVDEKNAAWHAGRVATPSWQGIISTGNGSYINPNLYTIGIEHEGNENSEWTAEMYASSAALVRDICTRYGLPLDRNHVIGHHEIYAIKTCPGFKVDLNKLIDLAGGLSQVFATESPETVVSSGNVLTNTSLNLRSKPSRNGPPVTTVAAGIKLAYDGYTEQGESVEGNSKWFFTHEGNWFWSGGVKPAPAALDASGVSAQDITKAELKQIFTRADDNRINDLAGAFNQGYAVFLVDTPLRRAHFFAQVLEEVGPGASTKKESLNYAADRLKRAHDIPGNPNRKKSPFSYFLQHPEEADRYGRLPEFGDPVIQVADEEAIANRVYANKLDNGDIASGDGWKYRGKGFIQLTGKANYRSIQRHIDAKLPQSGIDIINNDEDILNVKGAMISAMAFFSRNNIHLISDAGATDLVVDRVTSVVNPGTPSRAERKAHFKNMKNVFHLS